MTPTRVAHPPSRGASLKAIPLCVSIALSLGAPQARADWFGRELDRGGSVSAYKSRIVAAAGRRHVISGDCMSACTLWLAHKNTCVMPDAVLWFHGAARGVVRGFMVNPWREVNAAGNSILLASYPPRVRAVVAPWLQSREYHSLTGRELAALGVPLCAGG
jgi:hypothetical protein